ncbi:MAG TPA: transcription-repair coupling factor [Methylomirabilota bacterium]|nr:transcription-repair coupling factor [Methylomirabilota bacterium]
MAAASAAYRPPSSSVLTVTIPSLLEWGDLARAREAVYQGADRVVLEGLWGSAKALALAGILPAGRPACVVVPPGLGVPRAVDDLRAFAALTGTKAATEIVAFPAPHAALWRGGADREEEAERAALLERLLRGESLWLVTTPRGVTGPLPEPEGVRRQRLTIAVGEAIDREALVEHLAGAGYERVETVNEVGQWSVRGGIVDLFSPARPTPVRLELFGDDVESIRAFDPTTQRSIETLPAIAVLPMVPAGVGPATLLTYLPAEAPCVIEDPQLLEPADGEPDLGAAIAGRPRVECGLLVTGATATFRLETRSVESFRGQFRRLAASVTAWRGEGFRVRLLAGEPETAARLQEILRDHELEAPVIPTLLTPESLAVAVGGAHAGFECPALGLVCLTETELFGSRRTGRRRPAYQRGSGLTAFTDLASGDLVVHVEHGIGRYAGLVTLTVDGQEGDYLLLDYAESDRLYLPVQRMAAVSKYVGGGEGPARIDKLGGTSWQKTKESVRAAVRQIAGDLLQLYAARQVLSGFAVGPDTPWQHEFEAAFPFEETPDQLEAIAEVRADLEKPRPMDRLVCGDVGYGKTEVAMRAALKAALDGRQVAMLVPTTILAQQHWSTFRERFAPYPVRVEVLSRFRSPKDQKAILAGLAAGTVDIVIGTHRLLSKDVAFKDLGLLVVDEEHRFGVSHKERLKQLRKTVHVLTLTATPIPRTLSMALSGIRDLSVIETPPADRLAVDTVVCRFDSHVIKDAIERELSRGGQVFVVHNRIQSLPALTRLLQRLVPRARIAVAHGQLPEAALERTMTQYVAGEYDVLVSTAIVESGLDIPASNTIIINRADRFGLAQLYQLRGRVGRDRLQAYAYLLIPADGRVDETAAKRLRVIQELTELGSGLKVALRDLEIRGAGNLLGAEQHGQIEAVGFDLYMKLLDEAVRELRGEPVEEELDPVVTVDAAAYLPEHYVAEAGQRLAIYKRLAGLRSEAELAEVRAELVDRFGPLPTAAEHLLDVVALRLLAKALRIEKLEVRGGRSVLTFASGATPSSLTPDRLLAFLRRHGKRVRLVRDFVLEATVPAAPWRETQAGLMKLLKELM